MVEQDNTLDETGQNVELYKTSELRPLPFSKTVTMFDVYETDEENFVPYVSPLATVGSVNTSSTTDTQITDDNIVNDESMGLSGLTGDTNENKDNGILGLGDDILGLGL